MEKFYKQSIPVSYMIVISFGLLANNIRKINDILINLNNVRVFIPHCQQRKYIDHVTRIVTRENNLCLLSMSKISY